VLKQQWHFPGFVTSDWGATHSTVPSALAGLDMQMPGGQGFGTDYYGAPLKQAVQAGQVPMATLDSMVSRILTEMFRFNLFAHPPSGELTATVTTPAHARTGQAVAESGTVLLKNTRNVLPLKPRTSVAVIGSDAGKYAMTSGGGSAGVVAPYVVTPQQGITQRGARSGVTVSYAQGDVPVSGALDTVPATAFPGGLNAAYYNNTTQAGTPVTTGTVPGIALSWNGKSPAAGVNAAFWSARFTGTIKAPAAGTYALSLTVTGSATVTINGKQVFNAQNAFNSTDRATIDLPAGGAAIEVDYADTIPVGNDGVTLGWALQTPSLLTQAVAAARKADVAVVFASNFETEGADLADIGLPPSENQLISAVAAANPDTVVVLNTGDAVTMPWINQVKGVIEAWYPGQDDGREIAAVLFGDVNPAGKLPVTFPRSLAQVPASTQAQWPGVNGNVQYSEGVLVGYRWYATKHITPMFPFGYGLSYTTFAYSHLAVRPGPGRGNLTVTADVTNTGSRAGTDVAQLYVGDPAATGEPAEQLKGFQRVTLRPGQTRRVSFTVGQRAFAWWNEQRSSWTVSPGSYALMVGDSSANLPLITHVKVS
jgi:beta-glucosidase